MIEPIEGDGLEILWRAFPNAAGSFQWRVRCKQCGLCYVTTGVRWRVVRRKGCRSCAQKKRRA
jgi:hypothetical protein